MSGLAIKSIAVGLAVLKTLTELEQSAFFEIFISYTFIRNLLGVVTACAFIVNPKNAARKISVFFIGELLSCRARPSGWRRLHPRPNSLRPGHPFWNTRPARSIK